ncbi:hypothetical protein QUF95_15360 [Paenibacillus silvae]|uniref:hypothetical protein n=1 Tax=Paenibacillus silvae TaxID=1325358 RepID=UPI0025A07710|nr:hypothetical protein [Paenibacillus silvae]MDM5278775.1 hypothetical protein [Paenibacillus silvae]
MNKIELAYIEVQTESLLDSMSQEREAFYRKHTLLFNKLKLRLPSEVRDELNEVEALFNESLVDGIELYRLGFEDGIQFAKKSP